MLELDAQMREAKIPAEEQALKEWDDAFEHLTEEDLTYAKHFFSFSFFNSNFYLNRNQLIATQEGLANTGQAMRTHLVQTVPQLAHTLAQISVLPVLETDLKEQVDLVQEAIDTQQHVSLRTFLSFLLSF
jgi:hypothetical protein